MNIQIFGTKKCQDTRKAERYFKERKIPYQFIDLTIKGLSKGELTSIQRFINIRELINTTSKEYQASNLRYIVHNTEDILLNKPLLFKTPIVRNSPIGATVGYCPDSWKQWQD
ncbi:arsenate reductase family protein [Pelosinus sp. UFO1]|uniref:arsenate reductase family protein n=1 Tax=Pelosinus sp. UFO1 TaxID=484770 RepID=UPI0004D17AC6|nr:arsenate reductase family protein [Pelosinus sp. UFO1]AIF52083.1 arsenate reductase like protein [Pelosinus sp. UFO1]